MEKYKHPIEFKIHHLGHCRFHLDTTYTWKQKIKSYLSVQKWEQANYNSSQIEILTLFEKYLAQSSTQYWYLALKKYRHKCGMGLTLNHVWL